MSQFKEGMKDLLFLWGRGVIVIVEIFLILFGLYWFNTWFFALPEKAQMKLIWIFIFALLAVPVPLILGAMAGLYGSAARWAGRFFLYPRRSGRKS